jgi:hypothetical protein
MASKTEQTGHNLLTNGEGSNNMMILLVEKRTGEERSSDPPRTI